jgi:hypothetical protein
MKKYTVMLSLGLFLVMFFQNCGKPPSSGNSQEMTGVSPAAQQFNKYSIGSFQTLSLWDFKKARFLDLDMASGQMVADGPKKHHQWRRNLRTCHRQQSFSRSNVHDGVSLSICDHDRSGRRSSTGRTGQRL